MGELAQQLKPEQIMAALLDAQGHTRAELAKAAGVAESTISGWRRQDVYLEAVDHYRHQGVANLQSLVQRVSADVLEGTQKAIAVLVAELEATDPETGDPLWVVRHAAAKLLLQHGVQLIAPAGGGEASSGAASSASVTVVLPDKPDIVEGTGEEVT